jgi:hypothetical protein
MGDDLDEIAPRRRLAAGKMRVQDANFRSFGKYSLPGLGIEFAAADFRFHRIRTIGASKRATVSEFGEKADRSRNPFHRAF